MQIGVLGGTGPAGAGLAARLASVGFDVVIGSRSRERAVEVRDGILERWPGHDLPLQGAENEGAAAAEVVVVATPWDAAPATVAPLAGALDGKVVISMANALAKVGRALEPLVLPRGSVAASIQAAVPGARVSAALHHVPARELGDIEHPVESDVLVCSDDPSATEVTMDVVGRIPGLRALDAGGLWSAAPIEAFVAVLLQLNVRYRTRSAIRFTGIGD